MNQTDEIILELLDYLRLIKEVKSEADFARRIGSYRATLTKIKKGTAHFTVEQIGAICREFNVNANFLFGAQKKVFNTDDSIEIDRYLKSENIETTAFLSSK